MSSDLAEEKAAEMTFVLLFSSIREETIIVQ